MSVYSCIAAVCKARGIPAKGVSEHLGISHAAFYNKYRAMEPSTVPELLLMDRKGHIHQVAEFLQVPVPVLVPGDLHQLGLMVVRLEEKLNGWVHPGKNAPE